MTKLTRRYIISYPETDKDSILLFYLISAHSQFTPGHQGSPDITITNEESASAIIEAALPRGCNLLSVLYPLTEVVSRY